MSMFNGMNISSSALTANRLRMDITSSNLANANTTRAKLVNGKWEPYRREMVELSAMGGSNFNSMLQAAMGETDNSTGQGVKVKQIVQDQTPFKRVYQPDSPDADQNGYVLMPNVDPLREMVDLMDATRSYEANVASFNASKAMLLKTLEIGR
jgi:flagellar basal-body rod protein FlgC